MTTAARFEKARRVFVLTTDVAVVLIASMLVLRLAVVAGRYDSNVWLTLGAGACDVAVSAVFARLCRSRMRDRPRPVWELAAATVLAFTALALSPTGDAGGALLVWTGMVALYFSWPVIVGCGIVMVLTTSLYVHFAVSDEVLLFNLVAVTIQVGACIALMRVWLFLWHTLREAMQAQEAKAALAVSEERLRFARDLHDLLGHSLSVITVKSELAAKLLDRDADRTSEELAEIRRLAKESLREVRAAVQGYRAVDLGSELASVRAVLQAAGVRCEVRGDGSELSEQTRTLLAWAIREGVTNILKHSTATYCEISIDGGVLEMHNDGAHRAADGAGTGLGGLSERVSAAGGSVSTTRESGRFLLRAEVPA